MDLTESQKKYLRGLGHQLKPLVMVGDAGLSDAVLAEFESTLDHHELIKVRVPALDKAGKKELLQVSSKTTTTLPADLKDNLGILLSQILPAGSVSGTPKKSTVNIIKHVENFDREFYTGVFGIFDGESLRSGVMIRFIEQEKGQLFYKSGGGITIDSNPKSEYEELIDKIYLPFS